MTAQSIEREPYLEVMMKMTLLSLIASSFLKLGAKLLKLVPTRYRPYVKTAGRALENLPAFVRGFLFSQRFESCNGMGTSADSPDVASMAHSANPFATYFDSHTEGPGIWKWRHYFAIYHRHLAKFIGQEVHILEIGVYSGGSMEMWKSCFGSRCYVYGVDIEAACKSYESESVKIFVGDQADRNFWKRFKEETPALDIIIDDGGHMAHQQIVTLEELLSRLRPGGVYICEDVYGTFNPFHAYVNGLTQHLNAYGDPFQRIIHAVHLYPFVVIIEKREAPLSELVAQKRGTQWQPWL